MRENKINPSLLEQRKPGDLLDTFSKSEKKAFSLMTNEELNYLKQDCLIDKYIAHLRNGALNKAVGSDFPILVVKGNHLQLERFKMTFLLSLMDYQGIQVYHPVDFQLGKHTYDEAQDFTGVVIIKIPYGSSTTDGFDRFRSDLITDVLSVRRERFNPTIVLTEESIAGKLNQSFGLIKVIELDPKKLSGSYDGTIVQVDTTVASRVKESPRKEEYVEYKPEQCKANPHVTNSNNYTKQSKTNKINVNDLRKK